MTKTLKARGTYSIVTTILLCAVVICISGVDARSNFKILKGQSFFKKDVRVAALTSDEPEVGDASDEPVAGAGDEPAAAPASDAATAAPASDAPIAENDTEEGCEAFHCPSGFQHKQISLECSDNQDCINKCCDGIVGPSSSLCKWKGDPYRGSCADNGCNKFCKAKNCDSGSCSGSNDNCGSTSCDCANCPDE